MIQYMFMIWPILSNANYGRGLAKHINKNKIEIKMNRLLLLLLIANDDKKIIKEFDKWFKENYEEGVPELYYVDEIIHFFNNVNNSLAKIIENNI